MIPSMKNYKDFFRGKRVTILGLGLLGKGLGDTLFLAKEKAQLTVTDLKSPEELKPSITKLKTYKNIRFVLGKHELHDFEAVDFILKAQGVPLDSPYVSHARKRGIPIRMDDELFLECIPNTVTIIGVTGTRGKTTTATLIYEILKRAGKRVHLAGNIRGVATLSLIPKIKSHDIVVLELSSWQLQGFHERKISPHIAVFTNFMDDHLNYYPSRKEYFYDKSAIYKYQKREDVVIVGQKLKGKIKTTPGKKIIAKALDVPKEWKPILPGDHNRENIACAIAVAKVLKIPVKTIEKAVLSFKGVHGRLELLRTFRGMKIYNDNSSSTPESTLTALRALAEYKGKIIPILGGASKGLSMSTLGRELPKYAKKIIWLKGSGTDELRSQVKKISSENAGTLQEGIQRAIKNGKKGDVILFSPAFASFGMFVNVYDRGDQFVKLVKEL